MTRCIPGCHYWWMAFSCSDCTKTFTSYRALNGHKRLHGSSQGSYQNRLRKKLSEFSCLNCQTLSSYDPKSSTGKFCSNKCQGEYVWREISIPKIIAGQGGNLKRYLKETRGYKCEICSISTWQGSPLTLQLDHIDGNSDNNAVNNVRLICPNCHSQTETFTGRNVKNTKRNRYLQAYKAEKKQSRSGW